MRVFRLAACLKCRGDLVYDEGDWLCLQCGVYYYTGLSSYQGRGKDGALQIARISPVAKDSGNRTIFGLTG